MSRRRPSRQAQPGAAIAEEGLKIGAAHSRMARARPAAFSAGILVYHLQEGLEVLLVHPGGPFWRNRDVGTWQIPKGLVGPGENPAAAALREFEEETGIALPGTPELLCRIRQAGGKWIEAFALEAEVDTAAIVSNSFKIEWPPRSGQIRSFPEVDCARWFSPARAREMMLPSQIPMLDSLETMLAPPRD